MIEKESNKMIGQIWIEPLKWDLMIFEIGYFLEKASTRKGYATEAVKRSVAFLFEVLKASKVEIHYDSNNIRSGFVAERAGFIKEAHIKNRSKLRDGSIVDRIYYGLLSPSVQNKG